MSAEFKIVYFYHFLFVLYSLFIDNTIHAEVLEVGHQKAFQRIEQAIARAKEGDEVLIHPLPDGSAYRQIALMIRIPKLTIRSAAPEKDVVLDGESVEYSGIGSMPRAIIQFEPGANGCLIEGLTLINARNKSFNGAGVRINQANDVTIRRCVIRNNDMGIMSNGSVSEKSGANQLIEQCTITDNGTTEDPGYNHNLYLGGTSVTIIDCDIARAVTGHNVKSRAHLNFIVGNRIGDSANREIDLVDAAGNTDIPGSDSFLIGNTIAKNPKCTGNRTVIHFGRDGKADHDGTLWLISNRISTPFIAPVADMSTGQGVVFIGNTINDLQIKQKGVLAALSDRKMKLYERDNHVPDRFGFRHGKTEVFYPVRWDTVPAIPESLKTWSDRHENARYLLSQ